MIASLYHYMILSRQLTSENHVVRKDCLRIIGLIKVILEYCLIWLRLDALILINAETSEERVGGIHTGHKEPKFKVEDEHDLTRQVWD